MGKSLIRQTSPQLALDRTLTTFPLLLVAAVIVPENLLSVGYSILQADAPELRIRSMMCDGRS